MKSKQIANLFTLIARAGHRAGPTSVTSHAGMKSGHALHLADQPSPVALHGEIHCDVTPIGADGRYYADGGVVDAAPFVLRRVDRRAHAHAVADFERP